MQNKIEALIKQVYKQWRSGQPKVITDHPDEETLACFLEARLSPEESNEIKIHLVTCATCSQNLAIQAKLEHPEELKAPQELLTLAKNLVKKTDSQSILEIALRIKDKILELVNTTGDVLVGQELVPAPVLRSRRIKDFQDEVIILKDFPDIRVEIKLENKPGQIFDLTVFVKEKLSQQIVKDLRITLLKDDLELESYHTDTGRVSYENVFLGKYTIEISQIGNKLASVLLDIRA